MSYIYSSYSSDSSNNSDEDFQVQCKYCPEQAGFLWNSNYEDHLERVHWCKECDNYMPKESLKKHKRQKHIKKCQYCPNECLESELNQHVRTHFKECSFCKNLILQQNMEKHVQDNHSTLTTIGMLRAGKTDAEFNQLVALNRIFSKDGLIFIKN